MSAGKQLKPPEAPVVRFSVTVLSLEPPRKTTIELELEVQKCVTLFMNTPTMHHEEKETTTTKQNLMRIKGWT